MGWVAEFVVQVVWDGAGELAYRKWGWFGVLAVFVLPLLAIAFIIWLLVR